jgi:hypothetical protein
MCGSGKELLLVLVETLLQYVGLTDQDAGILAFFAIATHFADCLQFAPSLAVMAAEQEEGLRLLRLAGAICRHAIPLAGLRANAIWKLPVGLYPTLLLSGRLSPSSVIDCLNASQTAGVGWLSNDGFLEGCSPKIVLINDETPDHVLRLAPIGIYVSPNSRQIPNLNDGVLREIGDRLQPQLLDYRLRNHRAVRASSFSVPEFVGPMRRVGEALGASFPKDEDLQKRVVELLQPKDDSTRTIRRGGLDSFVVEALLVLCHENKDAALVGEITNITNGILAFRGERIRLSARKVGAILGILKFGRTKSANGYGFALLRETQREIHELGRALDVPTLRDGVAVCEFCNSADPTGERTS